MTRIEPGHESPSRLTRRAGGEAAPDVGRAAARGAARQALARFEGPVPEDVAIRVQGVTKRFDEKTVLERIDLDVRRGEVLVILGGSGSGKSTLLRVMTGALHPEEGRVIVNLPEQFDRPIDLCAMTGAQLDEYRKTIGVLFQSGALFNSMTLYDNVALPMRMHADLAEETIDISVKIKLELVGLREAARLMPAEISGGMRKRAGLARALSLDPQLLFYDEPSAGLDPITSAHIDRLILDLNRELGVTSVVVTHEMDSAFRIATRMVLLDRGRFVAEGTAEHFRSSTDERVRQFVHGLSEGPYTDRREHHKYAESLLGPGNGGGAGAGPSPASSSSAS